MFGVVGALLGGTLQIDRFSNMSCTTTGNDFKIYKSLVNALLDALSYLNCYSASRLSRYRCRMVEYCGRQYNPALSV
jgi:hypothetical protein